jgi:predicted TIM-barrel fold metal-dependent hydrolase
LSGALALSLLIVLQARGSARPAQKRAILYDNAARFLRLTPDEISRHHRQ